MCHLRRFRKHFCCQTTEAEAALINSHAFSSQCVWPSNAYSYHRRDRLAIDTALVSYLIMHQRRSRWFAIYVRRSPPRIARKEHSVEIRRMAGSSTDTCGREF
jgi:hypothetical protein